MLSISIKPVKAQAWFLDFAIAMLLFAFTIGVYFSYTANLQRNEDAALDSLLNDAKSVSSSLVLSGYPANWDNESVVRIGIADNLKVNMSKLKIFGSLNYSMTRRLFGTAHNYFMFFENEDGEVVNIKGTCGVGSRLAYTTYNIKSAYYYQDTQDSFLLGYMNQTFRADIYFGDTQGDIYDIDGLMSNISKYGLVVMEHPLMPNSVYTGYKDEIEEYASKGNYLLLSGELTTAQDRPLAGAIFRKKAGQSSSQRTAIVNSTDEYLALQIGESMVFDQYYYAQNDTASPVPASELKTIATFNQTDDKAIARWQYGNGTVYFFSDFDVTFFNGDFVSVVEDAAAGLIEGTCLPINLTDAAPKRLVRAERYLSHNSKPIRMVVYLWQ